MSAPPPTARTQPLMISSAGDAREVIELLVFGIARGSGELERGWFAKLRQAAGLEQDD